MRKKLLQLHYTPEQIDTAARAFWNALSCYSVFAFSGDLGAGKTTFIHHLCEVIGVQDSVSSPTFALINEYHYAGMEANDCIIYHMDWYRLKNSAEAIHAGMEDCLLQAAAGQVKCFVEWPEIAADIFSPPYLWISITTLSAEERKMEVWLEN